ncbi:MAG: M16 family metallopeptidase [Bdellovibrionales bacterium]
MRFLLITLLLLSFPSLGWANERFLDIQELTTPSGIPVWLVEDHSVPIISLKFSFKGAGAVHETSEKQGLVQILSNTMDEGAGDLDSQTFQKTLSDNSISLSFSGGRDNFSGNLKTLTENKETAFDLLHLALTEPRFDAEPLERMKQSNISRIKNSMPQPSWINARIMNDIAFAGHPYAQNSGGTLSTIPNITADDLRAFMKNELFKGRLVVSIAGDITKEDAITIVEETFSGLPQILYEDMPLPLTLQGANTTTLYEHDIPQTFIKMILPGVRRTDPDYYAAMVMNQIFGASGFGSRLMERIREKEGLTYGIYSGLSEMIWTQTLQISTSTKNETTAKTIDLIKQEASKLRQTPITESELQHAKDYILGSLPLSLTSTDALASIMLSLQVNDLPSTYLDTIDQKVNSVTIEDVQRVSQRLLDMDKATTILVGKPTDITPTKTIQTLPNVK